MSRRCVTDGCVTDGCDRWRVPVGERMGTPVGFAHSPGEISEPPREWAERGCRLRRWTDFAHGGHFAALEQPVAPIPDVREFFSSLRFPA
jgi:epoxide hydrolase